jgi:hypothetical protein
MTQSEVQAELNYIRARFGSGATAHEFNKAVIALEFAVSYCDDQGNIVLEARAKDLLRKLIIMSKEV